MKRDKLIAGLLALLTLLVCVAAATVNRGHNFPAGITVTPFQGGQPGVGFNATDLDGSGFLVWSNVIGWAGLTLYNDGIGIGYDPDILDINFFANNINVCRISHDIGFSPVITGPSLGNVGNQWSNVFCGFLYTSRLAHVPTNNAPFTRLASPLVSGQFWTNTTGARCTLAINYTLTASAISGAPSLCMTNITSGETFNATNSLALSVITSARVLFLVGTNEYFVITNQSSGSASAAVDSTVATRQ